MVTTLAFLGLGLAGRTRAAQAGPSKPGADHAVALGQNHSLHQTLRKRHASRHRLSNWRASCLSYPRTKNADHKGRGRLRLTGSRGGAAGGRLGSAAGGFPGDDGPPKEIEKPGCRATHWRNAMRCGSATREAARGQGTATAWCGKGDRGPGSRGGGPGQAGAGCSRGASLHNDSYATLIRASRNAPAEREMLLLALSRRLSGKLLGRLPRVVAGPAPREKQRRGG